MPKPLSQETREKIVHHKKSGAKNAEIAKWLRVTTRSVEKIWKLYKEQNTIAPKPHNKGRKPAFCDKKMEQIKAKIKEQPDITLEELVEYFNLNISISALCRKLKKLELTFKKRHCSAKNNSDPMSNGLEASGSDIFHILM
jgi:putative transposase